MSPFDKLLDHWLDILIGVAFFAVFGAFIIKWVASIIKDLWEEWKSE